MFMMAIWTKSEELKLLKFLEEGLTVEDIHRKFRNHSKSAVKNKIQRMKVGQINTVEIKNGNLTDEHLNNFVKLINYCLGLVREGSYTYKLEKTDSGFRILQLASEIGFCMIGDGMTNENTYRMLSDIRKTLIKGMENKYRECMMNLEFSDIEGKKTTENFMKHLELKATQLEKM